METRDLIVAWTIAGLVAAPIVFLVGVNAVQTVMDLSDPCTEWGTGGRSEVRLTDECPRIHGHSQTRLEYVVSRIAFDGIVAFAAVAGLVSVFRRAAVHAALGSAALLFVSVPFMLGGIGFVSLLLALLLFVLAGWIHRRARPPTGEKTVAWAFTAVLLAVALLVVGVVLLHGPNPSIIIGLALAALLGVLTVRRFWPVAPAVDTAP